MKKNLLLLCLTAVAVIFISSCCKEDLPDKHHPKYEPQPLVQVITVEVKKNQTWHYTLTQNSSDKPYKITTQAEHFSLSEIGADKIYTYTPALDYVGNDMVVMSNGKEHDNNNNGGCGNNNNGNCNNQNTDPNNHNNNGLERTLTIKFIIKDKEQGKNFRGTICPAF